MSNQRPVKVAAIVAMAANRVIGDNNRLPWHLPDDLKHFKALTLGKPIIMGRKTYESIGKPLPGRTNIVVTRQPHPEIDGVLYADSIEKALALATEVALSSSVNELVVIGGGEIYRHTLAQLDRLYITEIHKDYGGDAFFPAIEKSEWQVVSQEDRETEQFRYSFMAYERL